MNDMIKLLSKDFAERCGRNENYSLRSYARSLGVAPSALSEILNGRRPLSQKLRDKIGLALNLPPEEIVTFRAKPHGNFLNADSSNDDSSYHQLAMDSFHIISDWYHYGLLQLMRTKNFKQDPAWIAKRLDITLAQSRLTIERLIRVGIIEVSDDGVWSDVTKGTTTHLKSDFTSDELRSFQIKALEKAITSLKTVPIQYRDNTSMTLAVNKASLPFAKEEIKKFRRGLTKKLESFGKPDEVYQMAISLTPLTKIEEN
jgi:uncharacterized protein (TIGR02147 family)